MAALAPLGYELFCFHNSEYSEDAFVHQDTSVQLHKSSYDPETGQHTKAQPIVCKCGCEHPLVQGVQGSVGRVGEEVLLSLVYWIKTRTKRLNSLLGSKG